MSRLVGLAVVVTLMLAARVEAQVSVVNDSNGANIYISGGSGNDTISVFVQSGQVKVYLNGTTYSTSVLPSDLYAIGTNCWEGDDWVDYSSVTNGNGFTKLNYTSTNGGSGTDTLFTSPQATNNYTTSVETIY